MQTSSRQRIAIVGTGIAGLVAAHRLHLTHDITVFEADNRVGGHANTVVVNEPDQTLHIDTGFIVYNQPNYPHFSALMAQLGVRTQPSEMSFSFSSAISGLEYRGTNINTLLARRSNVLRPSFARMLADIPRFNRAARLLLQSEDISTPLHQFLAEGHYSRSFIDNYLVPLGASIWSANPQRFADFPVAPMARFLDQHGLLSLREQPQWRTISGGSHAYVRALTAPFADRIRINCGVRGIDRDDQGVVIHSAGGPERERFDRVVLATHSNTALSLLRQPTTTEVSVLGALRYQQNRATLHTDARLLPRRPRAWASWNYRQARPDQQVPVLTYYSNRLQDLTSASDYCITLNADEAIDPARVIASFDYWHPVFDSAALQAQRLRHQVDGRLNTHYAGAYWGYGFHEDGVQSAIAATEPLLANLPTRALVPSR